MIPRSAPVNSPEPEKQSFSPVFAVYLAGLCLLLVNGLPEYLFSVGFFDLRSADVLAEYRELVRNVLWIKGMKDVMLVVLLATFVGAGGIRLLRNRYLVSFSRRAASLALLAMALVGWSGYATIKAGSDAAILVLAGLRAITPAVIAFVWSREAIDDRPRAAMARLIVTLCVISGLLGLYQSVGTERTLFFGREAWLPGRVFSTLSIPSTYAVFLSVALYFALFEVDWRHKGLVVALILANLLLTGSGTGIVASMLVMFAFVFERLASWRLRLAMILLAVLALSGVALQLQAITGREGIIRSFIERLNVFGDQLTGLSFSSLLFGDGLGVGSNVARVLTMTGAAEGLSSLISDSTVTALMTQFGLAGVALFYVPCFWLALNLNRVGDSRRWLIAVVLVISMVTNVFELFPVNWIFFGVCGMAATDLALARSGYPVRFRRARTLSSQSTMQQVGA